MTDGQNRPVVLFVQDFGHGQVNGAETTDDAHVSGDLADEFRSCSVTDSQQEEQDCQASENELKAFV